MELSNPAQQRLACIGDASRFRLVVALAGGERCVSDLAEAVGLSQSCTTRHLQTLQAAGLVHRIRYGKRVMVGLRRDEPELRPLFDYVLALAGRGETPPRARALNGADRSAARRAARSSTRTASGDPARSRGPADAGRAPEPSRASGRDAAAASDPGPDREAGKVERHTPAVRRSEPLEDFLL